MRIPKKYISSLIIASVLVTSCTHDANDKNNSSVTASPKKSESENKKEVAESAEKALSFLINASYFKIDENASPSVKKAREGLYGKVKNNVSDAELKSYLDSLSKEDLDALENQFNYKEYISLFASSSREEAMRFLTLASSIQVVMRAFGMDLSKSPKTRVTISPDSVKIDGDNAHIDFKDIHLHSEITQEQKDAGFSSKGDSTMEELFNTRSSEMETATDKAYWAPINLHLGKDSKWRVDSAVFYTLNADVKVKPGETLKIEDMISSDGSIIDKYFVFGMNEEDMSMDLSTNGKMSVELPEGWDTHQESNRIERDENGYPKDLEDDADWMIAPSYDPTNM